MTGVLKHKFFAIVLLTIMVFTIFKDQIPYLQYELFKEYIAKNLCVNRFKKKCCCHGKCFLEKQVKMVNESDDNDKNKNKPNAIQPGKSLSEFIVKKQNILPIPIEKVLNGLFCSISIKRVNQFASNVFIPPKYLHTYSVLA
jgi:hypothetical protein